jgi:hypothetical protein
MYRLSPSLYTRAGQETPVSGGQVAVAECQESVSANKLRNEDVGRQARKIKSALSILRGHNHSSIVIFSDYFRVHGDFWGFGGYMGM